MLTAAVVLLQAGIKQLNQRVQHAEPQRLAAEAETERLGQSLVEALAQVDRLQAQLAALPPPAAVEVQPAAAVATAATQTADAAVAAVGNQTVDEEAGDSGDGDGWDAADGDADDGDLPLPDGVHADGFGLWPRPMTGGNNNYMQFRRHFRLVSASLYRKLHGDDSNSRIVVTRLATLESMLWLAVQCYCTEVLHKAHAAAGDHSILGSPGDARLLDEAHKQYELLRSDTFRKMLNRVLRIEVSEGAPANVANLMRCMQDLMRRATQFRAESKEWKEQEEREARLAGMGTPERQTRTPDVQREQEVQEHEVAALQATAGSLTVSMRGLELVVRVQMEEVDQLQRRLRQLLHDGDEEAASAVQAEITSLHDQIVRRQGELDALDADRREAERRSSQAATRLAALQGVLRNLQPEAEGEDQAGTSAAHARRALESQLLQARYMLFAVQLNTERRRRNIERMRATVESMRSEYTRQHQEMMRQAMMRQAMMGQAMQQPIPLGPEEGLQATLGALSDTHELFLAAQVVHTALLTLEDELQQEQAAVEASTQEQLELSSRVVALEEQLNAMVQGEVPEDSEDE